jgi:Protein of unknown function (DUF2829)
MKFHEILIELKGPNMIRRRYWDVGVFVFEQIPSVISKEIVPKMTSLPDCVKAEFTERGLDLYYKDQLVIVNGHNLISTYVPSVPDLFADDWEVL